jgi:hypothetical protein
MDNPKLGRAVLDVHDFRPENFNMRIWGKRTPCGSVACLAGTTLLESGEYYLAEGGAFFRVSDNAIIGRVDSVAEMLLGMTREEVWEGADPENPEAVWFDWVNGPERFRKIVERAEKEPA